MFKKYMLFVVISFWVFNAKAQKDMKVTIYNPTANAQKDLDSVIALAKKTNKHVFVQVGGNWCKWCIRLNQFIKDNGDLNRLINMDYVTYHLNYSPENKNEKILKKYKNPDRFGFPVLLILDADGNLIHTQDTELIEDKEGYSKDKLFAVFKGWTPKAYSGK